MKYSILWIKWGDTLQTFPPKKLIMFDDKRKKNKWMNLTSKMTLNSFKSNTIYLSLFRIWIE